MGFFYIKMKKETYKKLQEKKKLVKIDKRIFGENAFFIEAILNSLIIDNKVKENK